MYIKNNTGKLKKNKTFHTFTQKYLHAYKVERKYKMNTFA